MKWWNTEALVNNLKKTFDYIADNLFIDNLQPAMHFVD